MPSTRITIALNSKQSQKSPLLISSSASYDPTNPNSCHSHVTKAAQSKLRLKKVSRIFVGGTGKELLSELDWIGCLKDDVVLLVSAGEDYVGAKKEDAATADGDAPNEEDLAISNPVYIMANKAFVDPLSITQLGNTAKSLPGIVHAVAQPDLHPGTKFPIGAVFVSKGWIHPPLIGGDIGCGMAWYKTKLSATNVEGDKGKKVAEKLRGLEGEWRTQRDRTAWLTDENISNGPETTSYSAGEQWDAALGTIGAGNHFAEIQVVEEVVGGEWQRGNSRAEHGMLHEGEVVLLVHSGSRGYGGDILKRYTANDQTSMRASDPRALDYLTEHDRACVWASRNIDLIALRILACIEPGQEDWDLGLNDAQSSASGEQIRAAFTSIQSRKVVDICHNNVERTSWPPGPPSDNTSSSHDRTDAAYEVFIHRKGAAPISPPSPSSGSALPQPSAPLTLLPLPGSRGTPTLILHPLLTSTNSFGLNNALSLAHGAGRAMSRAKALTFVAAKYNRKSEDLLRGDFSKIDRRGNKSGGSGVNGGTADRGGNRDGAGTESERVGRNINGGTWVVCEDKALVWEEAPEAYKDVWDVGDDLVDAGAAERVGWCWGRVSYKVRQE
ncbi:hypothetical protein MMC13_007318 [Lambiella insularis]|nr:hypothetical protein [Lambiella insularis]